MSLEECNVFLRIHRTSEKPWCICISLRMTQRIFAWFPSSFVLPSRILVACHLEIVGMPLFNAVGIKRKKYSTTEYKAQVPSMCAKWWILDVFACMHCLTIWLALLTCWSKSHLILLLVSFNLYLFLKIEKEILLELLNIMSLTL